MSNTHTCATCVNLDQRYMRQMRLHAEAYSTSAVAYVATGATIKLIQDQMWKHVKVCQY